MKNRALIFFLILAWLLLAVGCGRGTSEPPATASVRTDVPELTPTATSFLPPSPESEPSPTPTPAPLALTINGESVTLDEFNLALQRLHLGLPDVPSEEAFDRVLADYVDQTLLAQAAGQEGFALSDEEWAVRMQELVQSAGGEEAFNSWMEANLYTRELLERDLRRSAAAAWMRDRIFAEVPLSTEQVRARQIRVSTRAEADEVLAQLNSGTSFDLLVSIYDPEGLGDLGWFPRGVLFEPAIEDAAFSLSVGDYGSVVETSVGFHIVQVTDFDADRPLDPDARYTLQLAALDDWLSARRAASDVQIFVP